MCTVLQFSGGKDSLACLYLLRDRWDEITVAWVNSGAAFPETIEQMKRIRRMVPKFLEIEGKQSIDENGYPVDVLPIASSSLGQWVEPQRSRRFQSRYACCAVALWWPMQRAMREIEATVIIRGQKRSDPKTAPIKNGAVIEGIRYEFPLEDWSDAQVTQYLIAQDVQIPANYAYMNTGLDCWNCTAYLDENVGKLAYMRAHHPAKHDHVKAVLSDLHRTLDEHLEPLRKVNL